MQSGIAVPITRSLPHRPGQASVFAVFIAAYREDAVILPTVHACLAQDYPDDRYDVVVISDHMRPRKPMQFLSSLPIKLLQVDFEKSTNTKSLQAALGYLDKAAYDIALVIDADNIIAPSYLSELNDAFSVSASGWYRHIAWPRI